DERITRNCYATVVAINCGSWLTPSLICTSVQNLQGQGLVGDTAMSKPRDPKPARQVASNKGFQQPAQLFRVVAEAATDAIIAIDERSTILFINKAAERIFGYSISEMLHQQVIMLMPHYLREAHQGAIGRYLQTGQKHSSWTALKLTGLHRAGREFPIEVSLGEHVRGKKRIFTGVVRVISEAGQCGAHIRKSQEKFGGMPLPSPDAITLRSLPARR